MAISVIVATVALLWMWLRAEAKKPPRLLADEPMRQATEEARAFKEPGRSSPWRIPLAGLGIIGMILAIGLAMLLPAWLQLWIETDIVVFFLTLIVTSVEALGPLDNQVVIVVRGDPQDALQRLDGIPVSTPILLGDQTLLLGAFNRESEHEQATIDAIVARLPHLRLEQLPWPSFLPQWGSPG